MFRYVLIRTLRLPLIIWGIVTFLFFALGLLGDPSRMAAGQRTDAQTLAAIRAELGLDRTLTERYCIYLKNIAPLEWKAGENVPTLKTPNMGRSFQNGRPVLALYAEKLVGTAVLTLVALGFAVLLAIPMGVWAAYRKESWVDRGFTLFAALGMATPSFFAATMIIWLFVAKLHLFNATGYFIETDNSGERDRFVWANLVLPALTLGLRPVSALFQLTRAGTLEALAGDYIRTARAKGLSTLQTLFLHALPNAFTPILVGLTGWLAALLAGAFYIEIVFDWQGVGKMTVDALYTNDFPLVLCAAIVTGVIFAVINTLADVILFASKPATRASN